MAVDDEQRTLLNKQLLAAARQHGNVEELLTSVEYRDEGEDFLFDINCTDFPSSRVRSLSEPSLPIVSLNRARVASTLYDSVSSGSVEHVNLLIEADGCDVDPQNKEGNTPLHLAVQIQDRETRRAIVSALVETAGAVDSIRLTNKAGQTPNALAKIYSPNDTEVISLTTPPLRQVQDILDKDDIASDGEDAYSD